MVKYAMNTIFTQFYLVNVEFMLKRHRIKDDNANIPGHCDRMHYP